MMFSCKHCSNLGDEMTDDVQKEGDEFWNLFTQLMSKLKSLKLLHFFADHAVAEVAHRKVSMPCRDIFASKNFACKCV